MRLVRAVTFAIVAVSVAAPCFSQTFKDILKQLGKEVEKSARQELDNQVDHQFDACRAKTPSGEVESIDYARTGSVVVRMTSGRKYQLRTLGISGSTRNGKSIGDYMSISTGAAFSYMDQDAISKVYRIHFTFGDVANASGDNAIRNILASAVNSTVQSRMSNDIEGIVSGLSGTAMDGQDWCFTVRDDNISSIEIVR